MKRKNPVTYDQSKLDLIDVNDMVNQINSDAASKNRASEFATSSAKPQKEKSHESIQHAKKTSKKPLPFQNNYLKSGVSKAKNRVVPKVARPKNAPYDNFLKSGKRFNAVTGKLKPKDVLPSATITKAQHLRQNGNASDLDDINVVSAPETFARASTPVAKHHGNHHKQIDPANVSQGDNQRKVRVPAKPTSSEGTMTFEERVLKELCELKKNQESFEARIEKRIETVFYDQSKGKGHSRMHDRSHGSHRPGNGQSHMKGNGQSRMQVNFQSRIQYPNRQIRHREPVFSEYNEYDSDDFEEIDEKFPVNIVSDVEDFEFCIRRDLELKFRLLSRLNDLGGNSYKKCMRLKMKYLFTDPVLENYSWRGTEKKRAFKKLKSLNNLILRSVRYRFPEIARDEYKDYMVEWLKHSRTRQRKVTYTYPARRNLNEDDSSDDDIENMN